MLIPFYQPSLNGNEKKYVNECLDTTWISSRGRFVREFEDKFAEYIGVRHATSVCNGSVALHLALLALDIQPEDEIIVPTLTYIASVNAISHAGATPVFVDSLHSTWQLDPADVRKKITDKTRAIMAVHLYGHPCEMDELVRICREHDLLLIEDCAEAFGTYYNNQHVGTFGDIATYSFFGNKTLTTGEGGMVVTQHESLYERAASIKNQGVSQSLQYWHDHIGYNYRMTNICSALGVAQLECVGNVLQKKRHIAELYREGLNILPVMLHDEVGNVRHSYWMSSILLNDEKHRDPLRKHLEDCHIETRPLFFPAHLMKMYQKAGEQHLVAESLSSRGINLPSWPDLREEQIHYIMKCIREYAW